MDEAELVRALRAGDSAAARELVHAFGERLLRSAFLLCGSEADAQDLVQETFLQALQSLQRFRGQSSVYTWLHSILLNLSRHYHRDRKRLVCDEESVNHATAEAEEKPSAADLELSASALGAGLKTLSGLHREVLLLRFYEGMKIREIARHLGVSKGTVKSRLHYALERMQQLLPNEMNLFGAAGTERIERT